MVFSNNCVLAVLVNGTPSQELANGTVPIQFNSEYVIRVRNKDKKRRVVAKVFVDGENVAEGGVVINPNSYVDLEAPVGLHRRFKFVSLDSPDAVDFGKNGPNADKTKGLIEAHFHFEKEVPQPQVQEHHHHHYPTPLPWWLQRRDFPYGYPYGKNISETFGGPLSSPIKRGGMRAKVTMESNSFNDDMSLSLGEPCCSTPDTRAFSAVMPQGNFANNLSANRSTKLQDGCTVEGSYTGQSFNTTYLDYEDTATVLKIFLQGFDGAIPVVKSKPTPRRLEAPVASPSFDDSELNDLRAKRVALEKALELKRISDLEKALADSVKA